MRRPWPTEGCDVKNSRIRAFTGSTGVLKMNTNIEGDVEIFAVETESRCVLCDVRAEPKCVVNSIQRVSGAKKNIYTF